MDTKIRDILFKAFENLCEHFENQRINGNKIIMIKGIYLFNFFELFDSSDLVNIYINEFIKKIVTIANNHLLRIVIVDRNLILNSNDDKILTKTRNLLKFYSYILSQIDNNSHILITNFPIDGCKKTAINLWCSVYINIPDMIKQFIAIENTKKQLSVKDCINLNIYTNVPFFFNKINFIEYKKNFDHEKFRLCSFYKKKSICSFEKLGKKTIFIYSKNSNNKTNDNADYLFL